ncbi:MAG: cytochrome b/b6 domain-containing protein [Anaerolineales bacterium]|nr:cytochrome b/b6 domain-containing protein [Anaerolineales bacterium]
MRPSIKHHTRKLALILMSAGAILFSLALTAGHAAAQTPLHPTFPFLDKEGGNVLDSGKPVSTMQTCGQCHDTGFIASHSFHADAGLSSATNAGSTSTGRPWDTSEGLYGKWNPITYGEPVDGTNDLTWLQTIGLRHVGGGPAQAAGVEMNCFLCHLNSPDNDLRIEMLEAGRFEWANTATLADSGIVSYTAGNYEYNREAFDENGELRTAFLSIQDPANQNCGQCHGTVHMDQTPLVLTDCEDTGWETATTGIVFAAQMLTNTGMNLKNKTELTRAHDIHVERLVECTDCHFSINNPIYAISGTDSLDNLQFDPRRLDMGEYLFQPVHQFARGQSAQGSIAPELKDSMRRCESCHVVDETHDWLPYAEKHMEAIHCETCHIPQMYSPALQQVDWTVVQVDGSSQTTCRGVEGKTGTINDLVTGFNPALLQRKNIDGSIKLAPYNLITAWYWVYGNPQQPVPQEVLQAVYLDGDDYRQEIIAALDSNNNGQLERDELALDTAEKAALIAAELEALGINNPQIWAEVQPYSINHNVADAGWAIQDCETCHTDESQLAVPVQLASYVPGGVIPNFISGTNTIANGRIYTDKNGALFYQTALDKNSTYIFGHHNVSWIDWLGAAMILGVLGGISVHGGIRAYSARKQAKHQPELKKIFMYSFYERIWHWLQTLTILILAFTGLVIHKPEMFGIFQFKGVVLVHNIMAAILVANAALALLYNLLSGDIKRFIPEPKGFFNQSIIQAKYYLSGIFKNEHHPFEKTRENRLNPLQQVTYFMVLNVLLPLQTITGILMWGAQRWPEISNRLGGLPRLAPFHTLISWSFVAFIILHVYLTTTGHTPLAGIKSMIVGWDEVEVHLSEPESTEEE